MTTPKAGQPASRPPLRAQSHVDAQRLMEIRHRIIDPLRMSNGVLPTRNFMLSTPAHRLLRAIHGGVWSVAWWALCKAARDTFNEQMPLWWHEWRLRRAERNDQ